MEPLSDFDILSIAGLKLDARFLLSALLDGSKFHEFKKLFGLGLVCGYGRINGHLVGIVANNGILDADSGKKGAHFVHLATERRIPIIFLQNSLFHDDFDQGENTLPNVEASAETARARAAFISAVSVSKVCGVEKLINFRLRGIFRLQKLPFVALAHRDGPIYAPLRMIQILFSDGPVLPHCGLVMKKWIMPYAVLRKCGMMGQ